MSEIQRDVLADISDERERQDALFGQQNHHPAYWLALIGKQTGQLGQAVVNREWASLENRDRMTAKVREEAVQVAAVAVAMIEAIDRGCVPVGLVTAQPSDPRQKAVALGVGHEQMRYDDEEYEGMGSSHEVGCPK